MSSILVRCMCSEKLQVDERFIGQRMRCPKCGNEFVVPGSGQNSPAHHRQHRGNLNHNQQNLNSAPYHPGPAGSHQHSRPNSKGGGNNRAVLITALVCGGLVAMMISTSLGWMLIKKSGLFSGAVAREEATDHQPETVDNSSSVDRPAISTAGTRSIADTRSTTAIGSNPKRAPDGFRVTIYPNRSGVRTSNLPEVAAKHRSDSGLSASLAKSETYSYEKEERADERFSERSRPVETSSGVMSLTDLVEKVEPSVVKISVTGNRGQSSIGSGFVIDRDGHIVTNFHVVEDARTIKIESKSGEHTEALGFVAVSPRTDTCIIQIEAGSLSAPPLPVATLPPRIGEKVAAFGSPLGFSFSTTEGIVSGYRSGGEVKKALDTFTEKGAYERLGYSEDAQWVQTSAAISGGNSGGPLVNMKGEVIGINTWSNGGGQSLNFAVAYVTFMSHYENQRPLLPIASLPAPKPKDIKASISKIVEEIFGSEKIVSGTEERFVKPSSGMMVREYLGHTKGIHDIAVSADGKYLATCGIDKLVTVFDFKSGKGIYKIETDKFATRGVEFARNSEFLITLRSAGLEPSIRIRDAATGKEAQKGAVVPQLKEASVLAASQSGRSVIASWHPGTVYMVNYDSLMHTGSMGTLTGWDVTAAHFVRNNYGCFVGTADGTLAHFDLQGRSIRVLAKKSDGHQGRVTAIASSSENRSLVSGGEDGALYAWFTYSGSERWRFGKVCESGSPVFCIDYAPDGKKIAVGRGNGDVEIYDVRKRSKIRSFQTGSDGISALQFHPSGKHLILGTDRGRVCILSIK